MRSLLLTACVGLFMATAHAGPYNYADNHSYQQAQQAEREAERERREALAEYHEEMRRQAWNRRLADDSPGAEERYRDSPFGPGTNPYW